MSAVLAAISASAAIIRVEVGQTGLKYTPDTIKANKGDIVEFHFDGMHSVVAGDFSKPCTPATSGGFYSGILPTGDETFFSITINNTDPVFFYCVVDSHCQGGMVGVINQGSDTLDAFRTAASNTDSSVSPKAAFGGTLSSSAVTSGGGSSSTPASTESTSASTEASSVSTTASKTTASGSSSSSPTHTSSSASKYLTGSIAGVACLALAVAGMLAL
ncbi:Cupredoxin [Trichoderma evansii]